MTRLGGPGWSPLDDLDDIDPWTVDRLLDGKLSAGQVPPGYEPVVSLLNSVRAGVVPAESGWGSTTVPAMAAILSAPAAGRRRRVRPSFIATQATRASQAAAVVLVCAALGAGSAAAATGSLPGPVQSAVHSAAAALGVAVPDSAPPKTAPSSGAPTAGSGGTEAVHGRGAPWTRTGAEGSQGAVAPSQPSGLAANLGVEPPSGAARADPYGGTQTAGGTINGAGGGTASSPARPASTATPGPSSTSNITTAPPDYMPPSTVDPSSGDQGNTNGSDMSGNGVGNGSGVGNGNRFGNSRAARAAQAAVAATQDRSSASTP